MLTTTVMLAAAVSVVKNQNLPSHFEFASFL